MKRFYVVFAVILAFSILLGGCADGTKSGENEYVDQSPSQSSAYWSDGSEFTPVLRFVAASDTHVFPSYTVNAETRLKNLFVDAYAYAETQDYKTVDAVILNGDLCESGREVEYTHLMETISENVRQNETVVLPLFAGHECIEKQVNQGATDEELTEYIASYTGIDPGVHLKLNGYHIIGLSLGGIIAVFAIMIHKELLIPILCGIFLVENLSVMMQVSYFKYTKKKFGEGRRIFLMSPLHHHFQKKGIPEPKIVTRFWIVGIALAVITIVTLKIR